MSLEPYSYCPCGSGKKIKFCCPKNALHDLEKINRAIRGDQRLSALTLLDSELKKYPNSDCLWRTKVQILLQLNRSDEAAVAMRELVRTAPKEPTTFQLEALVKSVAGEIDEAVDLLQEGLLECEYVTSITTSALHTTGLRLLQADRYLPARAHLMLLARTQGSESDFATSLFRELSAADEPLALKSLPEIPEAPEDAVWRAEYEAGHKLLMRGAWKAAGEILDSLASKVPGEPVILLARAQAATSLAVDEAAIRRWRDYAEQLDGSEAVAAWAIIQCLEGAELYPAVHRLIEYPIVDLDRVQDLIQGEKWVVADSTGEWDDDLPPPRAEYSLLDRDPPETLTADNLPVVVGMVGLFGRETDREPRMLVQRHDSPRELQALDRLLELLGDLAGSPREVWSANIRSSAVRASSAVILSHAVDVDRRSLLEDSYRLFLQTEWVGAAQPELDGLSPLQAAEHPEMKWRLEAAVYNLQYEVDLRDVEFDVRPLLAETLKLGEPPAATESMLRTGTVVLPIPQSQLEQIDDEQLSALFMNGTITRSSSTIRTFGLELVRRGRSIDAGSSVPLWYVCNATAQCVPRSQRMELIERGKQDAAAQGHSPAQLLLTELHVRLDAGDATGFTQVFETLRTRHAGEPGIVEALNRLARLIQMASPEPEEAAPANSALWTPGNPQPSTAGGTSKSGLWLPGSE